MTIDIEFKPDFASWRREARRLLAAGVPPEDVTWAPAGEEQGRLLFGNDDSSGGRLPDDELQDGTMAKSTQRVPRAFIEAAELAAVHREPRRWQVLYRMLWRLSHGEPHLMNIEVDDDVLLLRRMAKAVGRDIHKMHAFVRFRKVNGVVPDSPDEPVYVAWHCPDHAIVRLAVPFFVRRFRSMTFAILTPDESAFWDQKHLEYGPGVPEGMAPRLEDELETLWCSYYGAIFNPARIKIKAMKREMPVRHWRTLPETALIGELLANSDARVAQMMKDQPTSAAPFVPKDAKDLAQLRDAASHCAGCGLCETATKVVFGTGPVTARIVIVGEQPSAEDDLSGAPFTGADGIVLHEALAAAGIKLDSVYITHAVKHSKRQPIGKPIKHKKLEARDIAACRPWLAAELQLIRPDIVICLGSMAALAVVGRMVRLAEERGRWLQTSWSPKTLITDRPAAILKLSDSEQREAALAQFVGDLSLAAQAEPAAPLGPANRGHCADFTLTSG